MTIFKLIKSVKEFGIFSNYAHNSATPNFERYNVVYGWNGTGKTTLTRLFRSLETGERCPQFPQGTFAIDLMELGVSAITQAKLDRMGGKIKVFNCDFIEQNLDLEVMKGGKANHVSHLGKANIEKSDQLRALRAAIASKVSDRTAADTDLIQKQKNLDELQKKLATLIKTATQTQKKDKYKSYDKRDVAAVYATGSVGTDTLSPEEFERLKKAINSENKDEVKIQPAPTFQLDQLQTRVSEVLALQVLANNSIERLKGLTAIEKWVEQGLDLHEHVAGKACEFCGNIFTDERLNLLQQHFSNERKDLIRQIDSLISELESIKKWISTFVLPNPKELFSELEGDFRQAGDQFSVAADACVAKLQTVINLLEKKKEDPYGVMVLSNQDLATADSDIVTAQSVINDILGSHNSKFAAFEASISQDKTRLEMNFLVLNKSEQIAAESGIAAAKIALEGVIADHNSLTAQLSPLEAEVQETVIACETINKYLRDYLGHAEIQFENQADGYVIKRNGTAATNLSEGEKTAIAFVYFIATLADSFDPAVSAVIIDDPISSLDANNIHHAFQFMATHTKNCGQLFVLTHNYSFLRKMKQWFAAIEKYDEIPCGYFQTLTARDAAGKRASRIVRLDRMLRKHDSEYHYLFKALVQCDNRRAANEDIDYEDLYPMVNAGRKVLETFLEFKYPQRPDPFTRLKIAKVQASGVHFDPDKAQLLYALLNDGSHAGFDTAGFDTFRNSPEILKRTIDALLDFIKEVDPTHYEGMMDCDKLKRAKDMPSATIVGDIPVVVTQSSAVEIPADQEPLLAPSAAERGAD